MSVTIHILEASGKLTPLKEDIRRSIDAVYDHVSELLTLPDSVDIVVADNSRRTIPELGVGGRAFTRHLIYVSIDPDFENSSKQLTTYLQATIAHELHHAVRIGQTANGYGTTLLEALVSEGLADHFEYEVVPDTYQPWSSSLSPSQLSTLMDRAKKEFSNEKYNHPAWFFGSEMLTIPRWTGYSLGHKLVGDYMQKTGKRASELVAEDARKFVS